MSSFCEQFLSDLSFYKNTGREREEKAGQKQAVQKQAEQKQTAQEKAGQNQAEQMQLHELRQAYEQCCRKRWLLDFDDILIYCYRLLMEDSGMRGRWQSRFRYILIDEFQDINDVQYQIIKLLSANYENLFVG